MPVPYVSSDDPKKIARGNRDINQQRGDELMQQAGDQAGNSEAKVNDYRGFLDPIEQQLASGQGGYNPDEAAAIQDSDRLNSLPTSKQDLQGNFLTPDEQAGIKGNTGSYADYFDPNHMQDMLTGSQGTQNQAVQGLQSNLNDAIDPNALRQSDQYRARTGAQVQGNQANTRATVGGMAGNVRGAIDPTALKQSGEAAQNEVMTPEEEARMVTGAGISAGVRNDAAVGALQRQALAAGSSPMGVAAYRARMNQQTAAEAGDAMTKARVAAQQARAGEALSSEQQRLGAQGNLTNVQTGTEMDLGKEALANEQNLGAQALAQQNAEEQNRQAAEQYLTGAKLQSATTGGEAALQNAQTMTGQNQQQAQYAASTGTGIREAQDTQDAARAATLGTNRQATNEGNQATQFGQGNTVSNESSSRAGKVADTRLGKQDTGLALQTGQEGMQNQDAQNAYGRQQQAYGTQTQGNAAAAQTAQAASQNPSTFGKIMGGVTGALGAAASFLDEGGIATEPTLAVVGEHGPEAVVPAGSPYRARLHRVPAAKPKQFGRRRVYGEAA